MENPISPLRFKKSNYVIRLFSNKGPVASWQAMATQKQPQQMYFLNQGSNLLEMVVVIFFNFANFWRLNDQRPNYEPGTIGYTIFNSFYV